MKKLLHITLLTFLALMVSLTAKADEAGFLTTAMPSGANGNTSGTITGKAEETWNWAIVGSTYSGTNGNAWQIGSRNDPVESATFSTSGISGTITKIEVWCSAYTAATVDITVGGVTFGTSQQSNTGTNIGLLTFEGSATGEIVVTFTNNASGHRYILVNAITVTYTNGTSNKVATPTFNPVAGEVASGTEVSFNCTTDGVTYYYTTDGTNPTTSSSSGSSYTVNNDVTLKVMAVKDGMDDSDVATAEYTIAKTDPNLAFSETNVTANYGEDFTPPTLTYAEGYDGTITYSSSNSAISVDPTTGEVSFDVSAIGKTTTITATASETENYKSGTASYVLTVVDPNAITGNLNNSTFGTNYSGTITIANFTSVTGSIGTVTVTYDKGTASYAYISNNEIRLYKGTLLTFTAPDGYCIKSLVFNKELTDCSASVGTVDGDTWTAPEGENIQEVTITKTTTNALTLKSVTIHLEKTSTSLVAKPTITPETGTYTEKQTVIITNNAEGATVYYTTDGTTPTNESTVYSAPFTLGKNGSYTIKAIAVNNEGTSSVASSTITINITVPAPEFTEEDGTTFTEPYTIHLTAESGLSIYYATGSDSPVDASGNLSGSSIKYTNGITNLSKATTINAVAMDSDGNVSAVVSASYNYNGTVESPYYENFDQGLGNFTVETEGTNPPVWEFKTSTGNYGTRKYAYVNGSNKTGTARLVSPVIDLTDESIESASLNFIHAGRYFEGYDHTNYLTVEETAAGQAPSHAQLFVREEGGEWQQLIIPNWFTQAPGGASEIYTRFNSGDISLDAYSGKKIQISFLYTADSESTGIWNVLKFALTTTSVEKVNMNTDGYVTYVTKNDIDWTQTLAKNTDDGTINVHGYKVVQFSKESAVFVEFGVGENETLIPAETPIIIKGKRGVNELVIARSEDVIEEPVYNLLRPSYGDVTAAAGQHLLVFQKESDWTEDDPYNNYAFFKLTEGRRIPERKAYLNGVDVSEEITVTTNASMGIFLLEDLG
ncbi:MAG: chitobiase/beta-hexosaminidase C-terminal domain-containing protein, partial [Prevotella sp.]|nr:chitobiase/beta-hexosaminidase C-terminal domain-containing protein [Prevotella sp.]